MPEIEIILSVIAILTSFAGVISNYFFLRERVSHTESDLQDLSKQYQNLNLQLDSQDDTIKSLDSRLLKLEGWAEIGKKAVDESKDDRLKLWKVLHQKEEKLLMRMEDLLKAINELRVAIASIKKP